MTIRTIKQVTEPLTVREMKIKLKTRPYTHTIKTDAGIEWGHDEKGFYYINQRMGGVKDHYTDVDRRTEEFILDELDRTDPKKMGS
jgi:hypothetical protein